MVKPNTTPTFTDINLTSGALKLNSTSKYMFTNWQFLPYASQDLGSASYKWKDAYISGKLKNGTDEASIEDIANLIAYAKSQGWIS